MFEEDDSDRQVRYVNAYEGWGEGRTPRHQLAPHPHPLPAPRAGRGSPTESVAPLCINFTGTRSLGGEQQNHAADAYGHGGYEPRMDAFAFQESKA